MESIVGKASGAEKETIIRIIIYGTEDGILTDLDYNVISNNSRLEDLLQSIKAGISGTTAAEVIEEIVVENIIENIELENEELYIAHLVEKVFQKAVFNYLQIQLQMPIEQNYEE